MINDVKYFGINDEVLLSKDYIIKIKSNSIYVDETIFSLTLYAGTVFTIIDKERNGFILENKHGEKYYFDEDIMNEYFVDRENYYDIIDKAYRIANNAIYFNNSSDYLSALYEVCKALVQNINEEQIGKKYIEFKL